MSGSFSGSLDKSDKIRFYLLFFFFFFFFFYLIYLISLSLSLFLPADVAVRLAGVHGGGTQVVLNAE